MVSDTWLGCSQGGDNDDQKKDLPIFVDRDGDRFRYVLDYMRDGQKVNLPILTVAKEGFLKDLEYYGFENVNADTITTEGSSYLVYTNTFHKMLALDKEMSNRIDTECDIAKLALYCFVRFMYSGLLEFFVGRDHGQHEFVRNEHEKYNTKELKDKLRNIAFSIWMDKAGGFKRAYFAKCLSENGLKCKSTKMKLSYPVVTLESIDGK